MRLQYELTRLLVARPPRPFKGLRGPHHIGPRSNRVRPPSVQTGAIRCAVAGTPARVNATSGVPSTQGFNMRIQAAALSLSLLVGTMAGSSAQPAPQALTQDEANAIAADAYVYFYP